MGDVLCAWCGALIRQGGVDHSHGICRSCYRELLRIPDLSEEALDDLPFGVIVLAKDGTVLAYNPAEGALSGREPDAVVGRHFFTEIAPCTSVQDFQGVFHEFCERGEASRIFQFTFHFPDGPVRVQIVFLHRGADVAVAVRRRADPVA